jgi:MFS family permease
LNAPALDPPARWFLASVATYMVPNGIQMVVLPYLMAIELNQSASRFGVTQMIGQLPLMLFLLVGGWVADRVDTRRWLMLLQSAALIMPVALAVLIWRGHAGEKVVLAYAVAWGVVGAFTMPARDGLLKRVSGVNVQRMVILAIGVQFATQMAGQTLGGRAAQWGTVSLLVIQSAVIACGVFVAAQLPRGKVAASSGPALSLWRELVAGLALVAGMPVLRATLIVTIGMGVFFGGVFLVLMPLAVRDLYAGSAQDISMGYVAFALGTLLTVFALMRRGGVKRPGRALIISQFTGCLSLAPIMLGPPAWLFYACIFCWGASGGAAMTMSRTIMQEQSPGTHQSRVMAVLSLATAGGGPLGAFITGQVVAAVGVQWAVLLPVLGVMTTTSASLMVHSILTLRSRSHA